MSFWKKFKKVITFPFREAKRTLKEAPENWKTHYENLFGKKENEKKWK